MRAFLYVLVCLLLITPVFGCSHTEIRITVPQGYHGYVHLSCQVESDVSATGSVDATGNGALGNCPTKRTRVFVVQGGQTTAVSDVEWNRAGDGILTGIRFNVR